MTSATDELRRLLDERGVEWTYGDGTVSYASDGHWCHAWAYNDGAMCVSMGYFTPAQAIDATLGRGTCEVEELCFEKGGVIFTGFRCRSCGMAQAVTGGMAGLSRQWSYCPNCGRRVTN